jgi:hypothetical protein
LRCISHAIRTARLDGLGVAVEVDIDLWTTAAGRLRGGSMVCMSFHDLPQNLRSIPLRDNTIQSDVVDLVLGLEERSTGAFAVMACDSGDRGVQPFIVGDVPEDTDPEMFLKFLEMLLPVVGAEDGSVLVGRGRRGGLAPTDLDREWHQAAIDACATHGVRLLGFHVATVDGVEPLPEPLDRAS